MKKKIVYNVLTGFFGQMFILILGLVVPRLMITGYGSDLNGLLSTISQIFTYMALLEAGISQATRNALFKPIAQKDENGISYIVSISRRFFRRITLYYGIGVLALCVICPLIIKTKVSPVIVMLIVIFEGMSGVFSFYFIETITAALMADGRGYVCNGINVFNKVISYTVKIVMALNGVNIIVLEFAYFLITVGKVIFYQTYFKRHYPFINYNAAPKSAKLKDRNSYVLTEIAWTIFSSTDMIILSIFVSTTIASVYSVYNLIFANLSVIASTVYHSVNYLLGLVYHQSIEKYKVLHDAYNSIFLGLITAMMCTTQMLIIPFIQIYTRGVTDVEYVNETLPILFCLVQMISWSRYISGNLTGIAGYAKQVSIVSLIEAVSNIVLSIIFVNLFGITGVLFATVISLPLKVIYCTYIADIKIMKRSVINSLKIYGVNYSIFAISVICEKTLSFTNNMNNYFDFFVCAICVFGVWLFLSILLNILVNPRCLMLIKKFKVEKINAFFH